MNEIKEIRNASNMTQREFAAHIGVSIGAVKKWESGETTPSPRHQAKIKSMNAGDIVTVETESALSFTQQCRAFFEIGYKIDSTFVDAEKWRAVMVK